jgi:hypothetical protein
MKKTWKGINALIKCKKKTTKPIVDIRCPVSKEISRDKLQIANILNQHFSTEGNKIASGMPNPSTSIYHIYLSLIYQARLLFFFR